MKKLFLSLVMLLSTVSFAQAYNVEFDWQGTGSDANLKKYDIFQLIATETYNSTFNDYGQIFTYQDSAGNFTESFTVEVSRGELFGPGFVNFSNILLNINLDGKYSLIGSTPTVTFNGGSAAMVDGSNTIATFSFNSALAKNITGSLLGDGLGMEIDFSFLFETIDSAYWGDAEEYLVGNKLLLSLASGSIDQDGIIPLTGSDWAYLIRWKFPGAQMSFEAVPEPSTILLLGSGLLGVALLGRRKFFKKS
jgi:hypothetical protein